jgi:hypothetical protein
MKNIGSIFKTLVFAAFTFVMVTSASAQQMVQSTAKVVRIKGNAQYSTANNTWQKLKVGDLLKAGTIIQTAKDSRVDLVLGDKDAVAAEKKWGNVISYQPEVEQDFIRVYENAVLVLDKLQVADTGMEKIRETSLDLRAGKIFGMVRKLSTASKYEVKVPNGVAGIKGTIYFISAEGVLTVLKGSVVIAYPDGTGQIVTQIVMANQQFDIRTGQFTPIPETLKKDGYTAQGDATSGLPPGLQHFPEDRNNHYVSPTTGRPGFQILPLPGKPQ